VHAALGDHLVGEMGSFSMSQTSCSKAGPRGPAVWMLILSVTGVPDAWANGGRLDWSFMGAPVARDGRADCSILCPGWELSH
jgi:hypothetical protein